MGLSEDRPFAVGASAPLIFQTFSRSKNALCCISCLAQIPSESSENQEWYLFRVMSLVETIFDCKPQMSKLIYEIVANKTVYYPLLLRQCDLS